MKKIIYGGHWTGVPEGWESVPESEQDLTAPLKQADESVDVIFTEHVLEHLKLEDTIIFFRDAKRVLKPGGILRTVCPFIDKLVQYKDYSPLSRNYTKTQLQHYYIPESNVLGELGIDFLDHGQSFLFDSLLKRHGHQLVWTSRLMIEVLHKLGFGTVMLMNPGHSRIDPSNCLERVIRGINTDEMPSITGCDMESYVVEAQK